MKIIDVSGNNPIKDINKVKSAGYSGVIVKATEGVTWNDPTFNDNITKAKQAGMNVGTYHFARPDNNQPEAEAIHYFNVVKNFDSILPPILDIEKAGNLNQQQLTQWALKWLQKAEELTGKVPWIYSGTYFYTHNLNPALLKKYPLWIAQYSSEKPTVNYIMWQYTDKENVPGVGKCDCSITNIDLSQYVGKGGKTVKTIVVYLNDADVFSAIIVSQKYQCPLIRKADFDASGIKADKVIQIGGKPGSDRFSTFKDAASLV